MRETLEVFAEDVGLSYNQVRLCRYTASKWPPEHRAERVPFEIHRIQEKPPGEASPSDPERTRDPRSPPLRHESVRPPQKP
ncbi:hypothetical protein [Streptomyces sp. NPDC002855]|uniref:hypothetical protein n=1 Tax=Streptomyces sp. NPDC002855 TaxID=3154437 RepID=UPI00331E28F9